MSFPPSIFVVLLVAATIQAAPWRAADDAGAVSESEAEYNTNPRYFQGDMLMGPRGLSGLANEALLWPQGKVYYTIASSTFTKHQVDLIKQAMEHISSQSCIEFIERTDQKHWLDIAYRKNGCLAFVGVQPANWQPQMVNLSPGCFRNAFGSSTHELLHAIGFYHEQARADRDKYIDVFMENAKPDTEHAFKIQEGTTTSNTAYDYKSIMHYESYAFSANRKPTMLRKDGGLIVRQNVMSDTDVKELNALYKCDAGGVGSTGGSTDPNCKDHHDSCAYWKGVGECELKAYKYMQKNCPKSCGVC